MKTSGQLLVYRVLLAAAATVITVALAEGVLRITGIPGGQSFSFMGQDLDDRDLVEADERLFWKLRPASEQYRIDASGVRGWFPQGEKGDHDFRIVCIGDSCTFGALVRYEEAYGPTLERMFRRRLPWMRVESMLVACPGYSTHQNLRQFEPIAAELEADLTLLYCGAWNDYVPALGQADRHRGSGGTALGNLIDRASLNTEDREELRRKFLEGDSTAMQRVPLDHFRENIASLIDAARVPGSQVIVLVPPLPDSTLERQPVAEEYRRALVEVCAERKAPVLDIRSRFRELARHGPEAWREAAKREFPQGLLFEDWVHPSRLGHRLIAEEVFGWAEQNMAGVFSAQDRGPPQGITVTGMTPSSVAALNPSRVEVLGSGFQRRAAFDRVFLGDRWLDSARILDDHRLQLDLPGDMPPGRHRLEIVTPLGTVAGGELDILPPQLEILRDDLAFRFRVEGTPGSIVRLWVSTRKRSEPIPTRYGPLWIDLGEPGRPPNRPSFPFLFSLFKPLIITVIDDSGQCEQQLPIPKRSVEKHYYLQALVLADREADVGALTDVAQVEVSDRP